MTPTLYPITLPFLLKDSILQQLASALSYTINLFQNWLDYFPKHKACYSIFHKIIIIKVFLENVWLSPHFFAPFCNKISMVLHYSVFPNPLIPFSLQPSSFGFLPPLLCPNLSSIQTQQFLLTAKSTLLVFFFFFVFYTIHTVVS